MLVSSALAVLLATLVLAVGIIPLGTDWGALGQNTGTVTNCSAGPSGNRTASFTSGECTTLSNLGNPFVSLFPRIVTCNTRPKRCAHAILYRGSGCLSSDFQAALTAVCGSCTKYETGPHFDSPKFRLVSCDESNEWVTIKEGCDSTCTRCETTTSQHPYQQCTSRVRNHEVWSLYSQGVEDCNTVTVAMFNRSDTSCAKPPLWQWEEAQYSCNYGLQTRCAVNPSLPASYVSHANVATCPNPGCTGCSWSTIPNRGCLNGKRYTCDATVSRCAQLVVHNGTTCSQWQGLYSIVCGSCSRWGPHSGYSKVTCDPYTQNVEISTNCTSDCSICGRPDSNPRPLYTCEVGFGGQYSVYSRGLFPCHTYTTTKYLDNDCTSSTTEYVRREVQQRCEEDHMVQCTLNITSTATPPPLPAPSSGSGTNKKTSDDIPIIVGVVIIAAFIVGLVGWAIHRVTRQSRQAANVAELEENLYSDK